MSFLFTRKIPNCDNPKSATLQWPSPSIRISSNLRSLQIKDVYNMLVTTVRSSTALQLYQLGNINLLCHYQFQGRKKIYWWLQTLPTLRNRYIPEVPLQVTTQYTHCQLFTYIQGSPDEISAEWYTRKTNSSFYTAYISTVDSKQKNYDYDLKYFYWIL